MPPTSTQSKPRISLIVPSYNEEINVPLIYDALKKEFAALPYEAEYLFVNDGSKDGTRAAIERLAAHDPAVRLIDFSRNFGKEAAVTAGLCEASGVAALAIDADLQHPPTLIPEFIKKWEDGADVVIGVRKNDASDSLVKRLGSKLYYRIVTAISETPITPRATDYRLIDRQVIDTFKTMTEHNRMTRGLIDWLGYRRDYLYFDTPDRLHGTASYSFWKLVKLATESFISHSLFPLRLAGYIGVLIMMLSSTLGVVMLLDRYTPYVELFFSGPAILANIILFLVGIVLISLGLLSFYIGHIYHETQNRPLYVIRRPRP